MSSRRMHEWLKLLNDGNADVKDQLFTFLEKLAASTGAAQISLVLQGSSDDQYNFVWRSSLVEKSYLSSRDILGPDDERWGSINFFWHEESSLGLTKQKEDRCLGIISSLLIWTSSPARLDPSTGLPNHIQMDADVMSLLGSNPKTTRSLILIELLDHDVVRKIFCGAGSHATDRLLTDIAEKLRALLHGASRLYYVGVGRFAIIAHRTGEELGRLMLGLASTVEKPFETESLQVRLNVTIGLINLADTASDPRDALRKVTVSAHQAKLDNSPVNAYDNVYDTQQIRSYRLLQDIPSAILNNEFYLVYQPKLNVGSGLYGSAEALLRWRHSKLGEISPGEFIPLAESTELIHPITRWVFAACVRTLADLKERGIALTIGMNISAHNLSDPTFLDFLTHTLSTYGIPSSFIQIECTEYSALASQACTNTLHQLSHLGFGIALDDFGSGYSNLSCLNNLPINYLKIDRSLIFNINSDLRSLQLLDGIASLGKSLGYQLVAEGVENGETLRLIEKLGFDEIQGYFLSKPLQFESLVAFVGH